MGTTKEQIFCKRLNEIHSLSELNNSRSTSVGETPEALIPVTLLTIHFFAFQRNVYRKINLDDFLYEMVDIKRPILILIWASVACIALRMEG
jgi:hypothetical protein